MSALKITHLMDNGWYIIRQQRSDDLVEFAVYEPNGPKWKDGNPRAALEVELHLPNERRRLLTGTEPRISWPSTSDKRPEVATALARALSWAVIEAGGKESLMEAVSAFDDGSRAQRNADVEWLASAEADHEHPAPFALEDVADILGNRPYVTDLPNRKQPYERPRERPTMCPNCGESVTSHTGSYCHACGEVL